MGSRNIPFYIASSPAVQCSLCDCMEPRPAADDYSTARLIVMVIANRRIPQAIISRVGAWSTHILPCGRLGVLCLGVLCLSVLGCG